MSFVCHVILLICHHDLTILFCVIIKPCCFISMSSQKRILSCQACHVMSRAFQKKSHLCIKYCGICQILISISPSSMYSAVLKGTVSWDFRPSCFIVKQYPWVPWFMGWSSFKYRFKFAEKFDLIWLQKLTQHYAALPGVDFFY
jgi:hypothetical protein